MAVGAKRANFSSWSNEIYWWSNWDYKDLKEIPDAKKCADYKTVQPVKCIWGDDPARDSFSKFFFDGGEGVKTKIDLPATCTEERWYKEGICQVCVR